jgi:hypothetical protein
MPSPLSKLLIRGLASLVFAALSFGVPVRFLVGQPFESGFDHALAQTSGSSQGNTRRQAKPRTSSPQGGASAWGDPLGASSESGSDSELDDFAKETDGSLHSFHAGNASLDVAFPGGGSGVLEGSAGARVLLTNRMGVAFALLAGIEKEQKKNSFGAALKFQQFFPTSTRVFPFVWVSLTGGKNGGEGNAGDTDFKAGAGAGGGLELFLLKELSISAEAGITSQVSPGKSFRLATGTSQLALHLFLGN